MTNTIPDRIKRFSDDQYSNENRLNARIQVYCYTENREYLQVFMFRHMDFTGIEKVVDLGCGNGLLWKRNLADIPEKLHIMLSDISPGMTKAAREALGDDARFQYCVTDACETPFPSNTYQMVIVNHMLYHIDDKKRIFTEINRLMTDDGYGYASTLTRENFRELFSIAEGFDNRLIFSNDDIVESFSMENGEEILSSAFDVVDRFDFFNDVVTSDTDALLLYLASCFEERQLALMIQYFQEFHDHVESVIRKTGKLRITNKAVLFKFRKKRLP